MNYARIYSEFIADRLTKQPVKPAYFERHHILPRCLGGGNEKSNIIRLTPEDHLFAHIVLAKIHGGRLWAAVQAMCRLVVERGDSRSRIRERIKFGYIKRSLAAYYGSLMAGPNGRTSDKEIYTLHHFDGRSETGNRFEIEAATGVDRQQISAVLLGSKKSAHGWYFLKHNPTGMTRGEILSAVKRDPSVFNLYHHDGREWIGSRCDYKKEFGHRLGFQTPHGDCAGWHRTKADAVDYANRNITILRKNAEARGCIKGAQNPNADKTIYEFVVQATGEHVFATQVEICKRFGLRRTGLNALFVGRIKQTGGIALADSSPRWKNGEKTKNLGKGNAQYRVDTGPHAHSGGPTGWQASSTESSTM